MRALIAVLAAALPVASQAADSYLCIGEQSTGFALDKEHHSWKAARFQAGEKYVIRRVTTDTAAEVDGMRLRLNSKWAVWRFGADKHVVVECMKDFEENGLLFCEEGTLQFQFSSKNGRFIIGTIYGYVLNGFSITTTVEKGEVKANTVANEPDGSMTPYIEIGTCSAIS